MDTVFFILAMIFIYSSDFFIFVWISCRFVAAEKVSINQTIAITLAMLIFMVLFVSALLQVPLSVKPLIFAIAFIVIIGIFIFILQTHPARAALAGVVFIFLQILLTIFLLKYFWYNQFVQALKYIFLESLY